MDASMTGGATCSLDGRYRYRLWREWNPDGLNALFVMLNPSTADGLQDDPTIRRCIGFAKREGYGGLTVVNLYALRATRPVHLTEADDPVGPENPDQLHLDLTRHHSVICAWGAHPMAERRVPAFVAAALLLDVRLVCLGTTKGGAPRHPLYVRGDQFLVPWSAVGVPTRG